MPIISFQAVNKEYTIKHQTIVALKDITFSIRPGSFCLLNGPSGSGKSTILKLILGVEKPTSGEIQINSTSSHPVGFIPQGYYLDPAQTVRKNIELPAIFTKLSTTDRNQRTNELSNLFGLDALLERLPQQLSGGQIQRVAIARALYNRPDIILADEPTSNLDYENANLVLRTLSHLCHNFGTTIILATHDSRAKLYANQLLTLTSDHIINSSMEKHEIL